MKIAIMQPYFMPYIGYFQLINSVDKFVVYDQIQYTKKGWINRNRILDRQQDSYLSIPLQNASDYLNIVDRNLSKTWDKDRQKLINKIKQTYQKAPHFNVVFPILEKCMFVTHSNLYEFLLNSLKIIINYLGIETKIITSSTLAVDPELKAEKRVIEICKNLNTDTYINAIGGQKLYGKTEFDKNEIKLCFLETQPISYTQFDNEFVPSLSIIDVMMFNSVEEIKKMLNNYKLI